MDFSLTDDQQSITDLAAQLLGDVDPKAAPGFDRALWKRLGDAGVLGLSLPESAGGAGYGVTELVLATEQVGRTLAHVPLGLAVGGAAMPLAAFASDALKDRLLPGFVAGETVLTAAYAEPFATDALRPRTRLAGGVVTGEKTAVPLAREAAAVLVPAVDDNGGVCVAVVDPTATGVTLIDVETTAGEPAATMLLEGVTPLEVLPAEALAYGYQRAVVGLCGTQIGIAAEALRQAAAHTSTREQFGRPLATFQAVAVRLGNGYIDVEGIRSVTWQAAYLLDAGRPAAEQVATAAFWAAEGGERVAGSAVHLHGGLGVDTDYPLHRWFLASKQVEVQLGGASWQLEQLANALVPTA
jgi:alkylation response protein AidB-like acyl-CoA dehydrogenase